MADVNLSTLPTTHTKIGWATEYLERLGTGRIGAQALEVDSLTIGSGPEITSINETIDDRVGALLVAGSNVTLNYNDGANTLTISASGGGGGGGTTDLSYDTSTRLLSSSTGTDVTLPLATGSIAGLLASADFTKLASVASGATVNSTDATLLARANHTGTESATAIPWTSIPNGTGLGWADTSFSRSAVNLAAAPRMVVVGGTVTDDAPLLTLTETWNDGADTFTAIKVNITNTASASASKLLDLQVGSVPKFTVRRDGSFDALSATLAGGTVTASAPLASLSQTWDVSGSPADFTAMLVNITNTNSLSSSKLLDLQLGGTSKFKVQRDGEITGVSLILSGSLDAASIGTTLREAVDDRVNALIIAGTNITKDYDDGANTLTLSATGSGGVSDGDKGDITVSGSGAAWTIDNDSVITAKILDANITAAKLATDSVTSVKILADAVTTAKILDSNVTTAKLAADAVTYAKLQNVATNNRLLGRISGAGGDAEELSITQTLDMVGSSPGHGDLLYRTASAWDKLPAGTANYLLQANGAAAPSWVNAITLAAGTITSSIPSLNITQTWNSGAVTFQSAVINCTITAAASASQFLDMQEGGTSRWSFRPGTSSAPLIYANGIQTIKYNGSSFGALEFLTVAAIGPSSYNFGLNVDKDAFIGFSSGTPLSGRDVMLGRDAASQMGLRSGSSAQSFAVYTVATSGTPPITNRERVRLYGTTSDAFRLMTESAGTGTNRDLILGTGGTDRFKITTGGNIHSMVSPATGMTDGFIYVPSAAGAPTGTPTAITGHLALYYDSTNNKIYVYNGAWKSILLA